MPQNFYKRNGSYYLVGSNQKILNLQQLNQYAQAGGREVSYTPPTPTNAPTGSVPINGSQYNTQALQQANFSNIQPIGNTLYGTPINNNINSNTIQAGVQASNIASQLPNPSATQTAIDIYTQNALQNGQQNLTTLQNQYNTLSAQQLQQTQQGIQQTQGQLNTLEQQRQSDIDRYRATTDPIYQQGASEYTRMLDSLKQMDYQKLVKDRLDLTNDIVKYSNLMRQELDVEASRPALLSVSQGRQSGIQQNYLSKIATAEAAQSAIDGNFNLAFDIMDKGATVIKNITEDRINFLNFVSGIYDDNITDKRNKLITLTADEKEQINSLRTKLENDIKNIEENKKIVQNLMSDPRTAMIAHKAGLSLTDTPDQIAQKLQKYYVANPTLIPDSVKELQEKYVDAGINYWDSPETITAKLKNSSIFKKESSDPNTTLTPSQLLEQAQNMVNNGQATDLADAINQIQSSLGGSGNLGEQVGTIQGLPAYATRAANPGMTRANRNNNPGNIKVTNYSKNFAGVIGVESDPAADGGNFLIFDSPQSGINAIGRLLREGKSYQGVTAEQAIKRYNGNGAYGAADVGLDPNRNFQEQIKDSNVLIAVATAIAKAEGFKGTTSSTPQDNSVVDSWVSLIESGKSKLDDIKNEKLRNKVVQAMVNNGNISQADAQITNQLNDKIKLIQDTISLVPTANAVGPNKLARASVGNLFTGKKATLIGNVTQLISQETLKTLLDLKKGGGTLGALSNEERLMLQTAATRIGAWQIIKDGQVVGYKVSEKEFIKELNNMKMLAQRALTQAGSSSGYGTVQSLEQYLATNPYKVTDYNNLMAIYPNLTDDEVLQILGN